MPAGHGVRARTRDLFARGFRKKGTIPLSTYLRTFKVGDYVDVKVNGAIHKGMPHKFYHGRTGRVWNVTKRAVGVEVNKQIGNRIIKKRLHVRVEHVQQSRCAEEFKLRIKKNDELKAAAKAKGETISTKRQPKGPKPGFMVEGMTLETVTPIPYDVVNDLKGGYYCSKGARANDTIIDENINNVKERRSTPYSKPSKKRKNSASSRIANVGSSSDGFINDMDTTLAVLIPSDATNSTPMSSGEVSKVNLERKSSRSVFQRRPNNETNKLGPPQQPKMTRITSVSNGERGAQVVAGWPSWLASVAGEAINGWIPRKADSFEKLEKIGQGTYSSVYKARDLETSQIVALKKVRFANMDPDSVRFMAREIIILRRLDHPNVMKLEGLASTPGVKFSESQIKCYMKQLLHGLEHCHSRGVLHRDIKGSNLLLDHNNNLKIGDFGLANFYGDHQKQPLTSRVVTLWYRPPELLFGSTDYGVAVDMWSTGCILAELFNGKAIMPGRTEVEQLHKIFKLCGSPSEEYWKGSKLPHATIFKPQQPYKRCVAETFKSLPSSALELVEVLLAVEPDARGTTALALESEFFSTKPFASDPSSLPKYQPRKELDVKLQKEEARRKKGTISKENELKQVARESKAVPAPDANAELLASIQKRQEQNNQTSMTEKFNPNEDAAMKNVVMRGSSRSPPPRKELRMQRSFVQRGSAQLTKLSNSVAARDASHFAIANPRWFEDKYNNKKETQKDGDDCTKDKESTG
ncbi:hypothetical protein YC2023_097304 [Brassica napus]